MVTRNLVKQVGVAPVTPHAPDAVAARTTLLPLQERYAVAIHVTRDVLLNASSPTSGCDTTPALHCRACGRLGCLRHTHGGPGDGEPCLTVGNDPTPDTAHDHLGLEDWHGSAAHKAVPVCRTRGRGYAFSRFCVC